jgi:uncharacterized membrane protein
MFLLGKTESSLVTHAVSSATLVAARSCLPLSACALALCKLLVYELKTNAAYWTPSVPEVLPTVYNGSLFRKLGAAKGPNTRSLKITFREIISLSILVCMLLLTRVALQPSASVMYIKGTVLLTHSTSGP